MTPNEIIILKSKISKVLKDHLTSLGYPNMDKNKILAELTKMWIKLEQAGLHKDLSYRFFVQHAHNQAMLAEMMGMFR